MWTVIILCTVASVAAGFAAKYLFAGDSDYGISRAEFAVASVLCAVFVIPLVTWAGFAWARHGAVTYHEFYSGLEKQAIEQVTKCERDGRCRWEYDCDPYTVMVADTTTDSEGRTHTTYHPETRYHDCPYVTSEHTFIVKDTLGESYTIGDHWFPENPNAHHWEGRSRALPRVPSGEPQQWVEAKTRIAAGNPGGTTKRADYDNFILASQDDIYEKVSASVETYRKKHLLPKVATKIHDHYLADKVYLPSGTPGGTSAKDWQTEAMRLNGHIGGEKHGDLHLVLIASADAPSADEYAQALQAYWQSAALGKDTLSKNGLAVVVGFNAGKVEWARSFTGMPVGNEGFDVAVREKLTGVDATPDALIPAIKGLVFAPKPDGYTRAEMKNFRYLFETVQPSGWQRFWIALVGFLLSGIIWALMLGFDVFGTDNRSAFYDRF